MKNPSITVSSGNVFADRGFDDAEARVLKIRAGLIVELEQAIVGQGLTQTAAANILGVSQSRVSDLIRGKVEKFSLDMLVTFAARMGLPVKLSMV